MDWNWCAIDIISFRPISSRIKSAAERLYEALFGNVYLAYT